MEVLHKQLGTWKRQGWPHPHPHQPAPSQIQPGSFLLLLLVPKLSQHQVMATLSSKATSALERAAEERSKSLTCWTHEEF